MKGAAQYLQAEKLEDDAKEMLNVIVEETHRLDVVVRQFLDYARPFELNLKPEHLNALVAHVLTLLRASGLPEGVRVRDDLAGDLPSMPLDGTRIAH